jgi:putative oxidoreductase
MVSQMNTSWLIAAPLRTTQTILQRTDVAYASIRCALGVVLLVRGVLFAGRPGLMLDLVDAAPTWFWSTAVAHYVPLAHMLGGGLLAIGLFTRLSAAAQLPAILLVASQASLQVGTTPLALEVSIGVAFLLTTFALFGGGRVSFDRLAIAEAALVPLSVTPTRAPRLPVPLRPR